MTGTPATITGVRASAYPLNRSFVQTSAVLHLDGFFDRPVLLGDQLLVAVEHQGTWACSLRNSNGRSRKLTT